MNQGHTLLSFHSRIGRDASYAEMESGEEAGN